MSIYSFFFIFCRFYAHFLIQTGLVSLLNKLYMKMTHWLLRNGASTAICWPSIKQILQLFYIMLMHHILQVVHTIRLQPLQYPLKVAYTRVIHSEYIKLHWHKKYITTNTRISKMVQIEYDEYFTATCYLECLLAMFVHLRKIHQHHHTVLYLLFVI